VSQYRIFVWIAWIGIVIQTLLDLSAIRGMTLYPPFKSTVSFIADTAYALDWLFLIVVLRYYRQGGFIPWIIGLFGVLSLVEPWIDISHPGALADALRRTDGYIWFHFCYAGFRLAVIAALFSVTAQSIAWRCRWIGIVSLLVIFVPLILSAVWKGAQASQVLPYGSLLDVLPIILVAALFRKTRRDKLRDRVRQETEAAVAGVD
jgi:hypothetical protein